MAEGALIILPCAALLAFFAYFQLFQRIVPGVFVGGDRLGGMSVQQAAIEIQKTWNLEHILVVTDGVETWKIAPAELGLSVDPLKTAQLAYTVSHDQNPLVEAEQMAASLTNGWGIAPVVQLDVGAARNGLQALSVQVGLEPVDASLRLDGETLVEIPSQIGYTINIDETVAALAKDPRAVMLAGYLKLSLKPVIPAVKDVTAAKTEAQRILATPVIIQAYDPVSDEHFAWTIPLAEVAAWLEVRQGQNGSEIGLKEGSLVASLGKLSDELGPERWLDFVSGGDNLEQPVLTGAPIMMRVMHRPTTYIVQAGDTLIKIGWKVGMPYWKIIRANPDVNPDRLVAGQALVVPSKDDLLPYPAIPDKRIIISISDQRLWTYQDGMLRSEHVISTGIDRSPTQPGVFQVQTHELNAYASVWDLYMPDFLGIYEAWPGFMNGIHGLPTLSNGRRLWANILGRPASYGCIIMDLKAAESLYYWADNGVVVEIRP